MALEFKKSLKLDGLGFSLSVVGDYGTEVKEKECHKNGNILLSGDHFSLWRRTTVPQYTLRKLKRNLNIDC